ncbi:hypothetical protein INR49_001156 [Caranx melampygus]|nr:hypothetical protein INR49_001156 [Caranx melampygus]
MEKSFTLLLHLFLLSEVEGGVHSLVFLSTGRVQPGSLSSFDQLTVFDGVPISHCGSLTRTEEFKPSLESHDLPQRCEAACADVIESLSVLPSLTNSTVGESYCCLTAWTITTKSLTCSHLTAVVQRHRGCSRSTSGKNSAFEAWSVNGMSFMTFDPDSQRWTGQSPSAVRVEREWNRNRARNMAFSRFIRQQCPEMIHTIQLKSIQPKTDLNIFTKPTADRAQALLICHVTTTDQSVSSVQLTGDGAPGATWVRVMGPVPGPEDGSVILRLTAVISSTQLSYGCTAGGHSIVWVRPVTSDM